LVRQFSRARWLTHLLTRWVMRGAQATSTQWEGSTGGLGHGLQQRLGVFRIVQYTMMVSTR
jgi:hypothetical protein